jgi:hypothetical protein
MGAYAPNYLNGGAMFLKLPTKVLSREDYEALYESQKPLTYNKKPSKIYSMFTTERPDHNMTTIHLSSGETIYIKEDL